jgi:hypothetical protein
MLQLLFYHRSDCSLKLSYPSTFIFFLCAKIVTETIKFLESSPSSSSSSVAAARDDQRLANWHFFSVLK